MSLSSSPQTDSGRRGYELSDHIRDRLKYENEERAIDREIISEAVMYGEVVEEAAGGHETEVHYTVAGITFKVVMNTVNEVVGTAYPIEFSRFDAITSNRWTQTQIEGVQQRVRNGKTELV